MRVDSLVIEMCLYSQILCQSVKFGLLTHRPDTTCVCSYPPTSPIESNAYIYKHQVHQTQTAGFVLVVLKCVLHVELT